MTKIEYLNNTNKLNNLQTKIFDLDQMKNAYNFHQTMNEYKETPCVNLKTLANHLSISNIYVKDESKRFNLNAFKVLGASYAIGCELSAKDNFSFQEIYGISQSRKLSFYSATDGNHGRAVAYMAKLLEQNANVYMPKNSTKNRLNHIYEEKGYGEILPLNYDDCVRYVSELAKKESGMFIQDTALDNYEEIPKNIIIGYSTMLMELKKQLINFPTHIFLQAGVGSFAASVINGIYNLYPNYKPIYVILEPKEAACYYKSAKINDGKAHDVTGNMNTIMSGLACGECNSIVFDMIKNSADFFVSCDDEISKLGMRVLSSPLKEDKRIISGESGAVGIGTIMEICRNKKLRNDFKINEESSILCISTEGDTDKDCFLNVVWN